jgi:hypothetical protein
MTIKDAFLPYIDKDGLVQPTVGGESGNGLLYTSEYIYALLANGGMDRIEQMRLTAAYNACQMQEGLMARTPIGTAFSTDQEGPDDYYGCGAASSELDGSLARHILAYGRKGASGFNPSYEDSDRVKLSTWLFRILSLFGLLKVKWIYNNDNPGFFTQSSWLGRQQNLICHLQFAADEEPPMWRKVWWAVAVLGSLFSTNNDSYCLSWLCVRTAQGKSKFCTLVGKVWWHFVLKKFPGGMGEILGDYFQNPSHPLAVYTGIGK